MEEFKRKTQVRDLDVSDDTRRAVTKVTHSNKGHHSSLQSPISGILGERLFFLNLNWELTGDSSVCWFTSFSDEGYKKRSRVPIKYGFIYLSESSQKVQEVSCFIAYIKRGGWEQI